ncbi:hypothetical protein GZH49_10505 [Nocardia terpenica]|uniref:hypothetical protein n=1 Tax=Nocardia terpenica TaxID=455432 RepID=UPI002FE25A6A
MKLIIGIVAAAAAVPLLSGCTSDGLSANTSLRAIGSPAPSATPRGGTTGPAPAPATKSYTVVIEVHGSGSVRNMVWHIGWESRMGGAQVTPHSPVHIQRTVTTDSPFQATIYGNTDPGADLRCSIAVDGTVLVHQSNTARGLSCETTVPAG